MVLVMHKRTSRRRWKAKALRGQTVPWSVIVEHRLQNWKTWERRHDRMDAYLIDVLSYASLEQAIDTWRVNYGEKVFLYPRRVWFATGSSDFLVDDAGDRRWMPL